MQLQDELTCDLLDSILSPIDANPTSIDQSLIAELLLSSTDSVTVGSEVFPAHLATDQQGGNHPLQQVATLHPLGASSTDTIRCSTNGPACLAAAATAMGGHRMGGESALTNSTALGMRGDTTQSGYIAQENEVSPLLSEMKAACSPYPQSSRRPKSCEHAMCAATEGGGRGRGRVPSDSVGIQPLLLQGEDKIELACRDKWKVVGGICSSRFGSMQSTICLACISATMFLCLPLYQLKCFNVGRKLIMEEAVSPSYRSKGDCQ